MAEQMYVFTHSGLEPGYGQSLCVIHSYWTKCKPSRTLHRLHQHLSNSDTSTNQHSHVSFLQGQLHESITCSWPCLEAQIVNNKLNRQSAVVMHWRQNHCRLFSTLQTLTYMLGWCNSTSDPLPVSLPHSWFKSVVFALGWLLSQDLLCVTELQRT